MPDAEEMAGPVVSPPRVRFFDVTGADGTRLRAWTNDAAGPTVLLCNGLGSSPYIWPALLDPDCGVRVISWNHRGIGGSARPADPAAVTMDEHVADAVAVLDHEGVRHSVAMGWSIGVNTAFELAVRHPERITGLLAVSGVPGNSFGTMLEPYVGGPLITPISSRLPLTDMTAGILRHSGFMLPSASSAVVKMAVREFLTTPVDWYMHLALHAAEHARVPLSSVTVPTVFVAGRWDLFAGRSDLRSAAERIPRATYVELPGSHFLPMERPQEVHKELLRLLERVETDHPGTPSTDTTRQG
jgi:pimeloyl-ACP methyl ester carboxylesterase